MRLRDDSYPSLHAPARARPFTAAERASGRPSSIPTPSEAILTLPFMRASAPFPLTLHGSDRIRHDRAAPEALRGAPSRGAELSRAILQPLLFRLPPLGIRFLPSSCGKRARDPHPRPSDALGLKEVTDMYAKIFATSGDFPVWRADGFQILDALTN